MYVYTVRPHGTSKNGVINAAQYFQGFGIQNDFCSFLLPNRDAEFRALLLTCYSLPGLAISACCLIRMQFRVISKNISFQHLKSYSITLRDHST